jgi:hypothetical protein
LSRKDYLENYFIIKLMRYLPNQNINAFMRSYKVIINEKARLAEYMRKMEIEKKLKQQHERILRLEKKLNKN